MSPGQVAILVVLSVLVLAVTLVAQEVLER